MSKDFEVTIKRRPVGYTGTYVDYIGGKIGVGPDFGFWRPTRKMLERKFAKEEARSRAFHRGAI